MLWRMVKTSFLRYFHLSVGNLSTDNFFKDGLACYFIVLQRNKWVNLLLPIFPQATFDTFTDHKGLRNEPRLLWQNKLAYLS